MPRRDYPSLPSGIFSWIDSVDDINRLRILAAVMYSIEDGDLHHIPLNAEHVFGMLLPTCKLFTSSLVNLMELIKHCARSERELHDQLYAHTDEEMRFSHKFLLYDQFNSKNWKKLKAGICITNTVLGVSIPAYAIFGAIVNTSLDILEDGAKLPLLERKLRYIEGELNSDWNNYIRATTIERRQELSIKIREKSLAKRKLKYEITDKYINLTLSGLAIAGLVLCKIPMCHPIGAVLLIGVTISALLYRHVIQKRIKQRLLGKALYSDDCNDLKEHQQQIAAKVQKTWSDLFQSKEQETELQPLGKSLHSNGFG